MKIQVHPKVATPPPMQFLGCDFGNKECPLFPCFFILVFCKIGVLAETLATIFHEVETMVTETDCSVTKEA